MLALLFAAAVSTALAPGSVAVTDLKPIPLHEGVNVVPALSPDGLSGLIVVGAPNVETADQSHTDYFTLVRGEHGRGWVVVRAVGLRRPDGSSDEAASDLVSDYPHTGEDQVSSVRFAHGRVDGAPATLMINAQRDAAMPIPAPSRVTVDIYRLTVDREFGEALFRRVSRSRSTACFDNADSALQAMLHLPPPAGFEGRVGAAPCP